MGVIDEVYEEQILGVCREYDTLRRETVSVPVLIFSLDERVVITFNDIAKCSGRPDMRVEVGLRCNVFEMSSVLNLFDVYEVIANEDDVVTSLPSDSSVQYPQNNRSLCDRLGKDTSHRAGRPFYRSKHNLEGQSPDLLSG